MEIDNKSVGLLLCPSGSGIQKPLEDIYDMCMEVFGKDQDSSREADWKGQVQDRDLRRFMLHSGKEFPSIFAHIIKLWMTELTGHRLITQEFTGSTLAAVAQLLLATLIQVYNENCD